MKSFLQKKICPHLVLSAFILIAIAFPSCSLLNSNSVDEGASISVILPSKNDRAYFTKEEAASYAVRLCKEDGEIYREKNPVLEETVEFENIPFGKYQVTVKALSAQNKTVASGKSELIELNSPEAVTVAIQLILNQYFNITYELDGGTNSPDNPSIYTMDEEVVLSAPEKDMYYFDGWFTEGTFQNQVESIAMESTGDLTLYARWQLKLEFFESVPTSGRYLVTSVGDLKKISEWANGGTVTFSGVTFELANDIALSPDETWKSIGYGYNGIGSGNGFKGTFDGAGHEISGLKIDTTSVDGSYNKPAFFGCVSGGTVKNLTLRGTSVLAGFVGFFADGAKIDNCINYVDITTSKSGSGGFVGAYSKGYVTNCVNYGTITSTSSIAGGIAGDVNSSYSQGDSYIANCTNYGDVTATDETGGIIGFSRIAVYNCKNYGKITSTDSDADGTGGIAGTAYTRDDIKLIANCLNMGEISGKGNVGGICGGLGGSWNSNNNYIVKCNIVNSVNFGNVSISSGSSTVYGGIAGICYGDEYNTFTFDIENSFTLTGKCPNTVGQEANDGNKTTTNNATFFDEAEIASVVSQLNSWASSNSPAASGRSYSTWKVSGSTISF
ncbi:MAG: InlB B-repeat-containing protein [Treponema sp.]|nr:InlB B-repeat-containing protein [Treponema sp.]